MSEFRSAGGLDDPIVPMGDTGFSRLNMRDEAELLPPGDVSVSENGRLERRSWQPRKAITSLSGSLQEDGDPLRIPFWVIDEPGGVAVDVSAERVGSLVTLSMTDGPFMEEGLAAYTGVTGLTGSVDPNGVHLMTCTLSSPGGGPLVLTFLIPGAVGSETYGGSGLVASYIDDTAAAAIYGSCLFSDPASGDSESIIEAASGKAFRVNTADGSVATIDYPTGRMFTGPVDLIQAFDKVYLFEDGVRSLMWASGDAAFSEVPGGPYTQPQVFEVTGTAVDVVSGLATITLVGNTTIEEGDMIRVYSTDSPQWLDFVEREFKCVSASATDVSFYIPIPDMSTIGTDVLSIGRQVSQGSGFTFMPAPAWGVYHQRRLIVPYAHTVGGTEEDPTYTARDVHDELVISDILDPDTYDVLENQFRITAGVADFMVAAHPFSEDRALVFMRNSIHAIFGLSGSLGDCETKELTREIGCLARKSIAQYASQVLFLADNGVYAIGFFDEYNLRPVGEPLSAPIQPVIDRINPDLAGESVGVYFNNRYWLAVPLDSAPGAGDATGNNAILVFNFLNGGWESIDSVADSRWNVLNLHISRAGERNDLYAVNSLGGVHKLDAADSDEDEIALIPGDPVQRVRVASELWTRQYEGGTEDRKRFSRAQVIAESAGQQSEASVDLRTEDPDNVVPLGKFSGQLGAPLGPLNSASMRFRVGGYRGQGATITITPEFGRPKVKSVSVEATPTNRSTVAQK